jgi:hypothetical protein
MTTVTVLLCTALKIAEIRRMAIPRWKRWRLKNPKKDKEQRKAYYWRNRDKIVLNRLLNSKMKNTAKLKDI